MIGGKTKSLYFCRRMSPWRLPFDGFLHFEKMNTAQPSIPVVLITGASSGIGRATARQLHERGCRVYGAARRVERMADLQEAGIGVLPLDVTRSESARACVEAVVEREERIDVLINNAGYGLYGAVEDVSLDDARRQLEVNLIGPALMTQLVLPYMRRQGRGRIVNVSSMAGKVYTAYGAWYHASKFGLEGWSDSLRLELKPFGIDVVLVEPGLIRTPWADTALDHLEQSARKGVYHASTQRVAGVMRRLYASRLGTTPDRLARTMVRAALTKHPRDRYLTGFLARPSVLARRLLPVSWLDAFIRLIERV